MSDTDPDVLETWYGEGRRKWANHEEVPSTVFMECDNCDKEVQTSSVFSPEHNTMYWDCPHCGADHETDEWLNTDDNGDYVDKRWVTDEKGNGKMNTKRIIPRNLRDFI